MVIGIARYKLDVIIEQVRKESSEAFEMHTPI